jgi:hypothetical protein
LKLLPKEGRKERRTAGRKRSQEGEKVGRKRVKKKEGNNGGSFII